MIAGLILILFSLFLLFILVYSIIQLDLLITYRKHRCRIQARKKLDLQDLSQVPYVTVQLPIYNEKLVVERLINNISKLQYPQDRLQIQVLDDSTDESVEKTIKLIDQLKASGLDIAHVRRKERTGFKAGALKEGLNSVKGEFIAIFDSDFLPKPDWLLRTLPYFSDPTIGVVQTRWGHLNKRYSILTRLQAFLLDFHFILEQNGRNLAGHFINFNGTAGIWRKECILQAGNWAGDTLTEDLDLSYRAQLQGWKFKYIEDVETPAELPVTIAAARSQQFRWNKGAAENFQKNFKLLWASPNFSLRTKIHCFFHLLNSSLFPLILVLALLSIPLLFAPKPLHSTLTVVLSVFSISTLIFFLSYWTTYARIHGGGWRSFIGYCGMFFMFFTIALGFSVHNSIAVIEGHLGKKSPFIRTPKFNITTKSGALHREPFQVSFQFIIEVLLMLVFAFAVLMAFYTNNFRLLLFHLMLFLGFLYVVFTSLDLGRFFQRKSKQRLEYKNFPSQSS